MKFTSFFNGKDLTIVAHSFFGVLLRTFDLVIHSSENLSTLDWLRFIVKLPI